MAKKPATTPKSAGNKPAAPQKGPAKPRSRKTTPGGLPAAPADAPAAVGVSGVVKYPYDKLVEPTTPPFEVFGDASKPHEPFTPDEFDGLIQAVDKEAEVNGDYVEEARKTPVFIQEVFRDVQRRTAGTLVGDLMGFYVRSGYTPNVERWQIPDPDAPGDGENTPTLVQVYCPPADHIHQLWAPDGEPDTVWTHTWRAMLPEGMIKYTGGKLAAGNQRAGLAGATLAASNTRELISDFDHVNTLLKLWLAHQARALG